MTPPRLADIREPGRRIVAALLAAERAALIRAATADHSPAGGPSLTPAVGGTSSRRPVESVPAIGPAIGRPTVPPARRRPRRVLA